MMSNDNYKKMLENLKIKFEEGKIKSKVDTLLHFAEFIKADIDSEGIKEVQRLENKIRKINNKFKKIHLQVQKVYFSAEEDLDRKPMENLDEITKEIKKTLSETQKSLGKIKKSEEATEFIDDRKRLAKEIKGKKELFRRYSNLIGKYNEFSEWARSQPDI